MKRALTLQLSCDAPLAECAAKAAAASASTGPCHWAVVQPLGRGLFVDPYSSAEADRLSTLHGRAGQVTWQRGSVDIEAAAPDAMPCTVAITPVGLPPAARSAALSLDVSARYHEPQPGGGTLALTLPPAVAVAICARAPAVAPASGLVWVGTDRDASAGAPGPLVFPVPVADARHLTLALAYTLAASALALVAVARAACAGPPASAWAAPARLGDT